jgi:hypothetical protein
VKGDFLRTGRFLVLPTLALAVVVSFAPGRVGLAIRIYALILCAAALILLAAVLRRTFPRASALRASAGRRPARPDAPATLARIEQEVALGVAGSFDLHHRLRPRLRGLAAELLTSRRGISLQDAPGAARDSLGEETWELVRPDRPRPEDRLARGIPIPDLARVVQSLEKL